MADKKLKYLIIHCTATREGVGVSEQDIRRWHLEERGWSRTGYCDMVTLDGSLVNLIPFDTDNRVGAKEISNGVRGINGISRHIVYVGGVDAMGKPKDTRTMLQRACLADYVKYTVRRHPSILIAGHYHFSAKACPSFNVERWCEDVGVQRANIYYDKK